MIAYLCIDGFNLYYGCLYGKVEPDDLPPDEEKQLRNQAEQLKD